MTSISGYVCAIALTWAMVLSLFGCGGGVETLGGAGGATATVSASASSSASASGSGGGGEGGATMGVDAGGDDAACQRLPTPVRCNDPKRTAACSAGGASTIPICYAVPGPNPLPPIPTDQFPTYGCSAPSSLNSGAGDAWTFWCCSATTPGPIDNGCGGTCVDLACLP